jgi:hypothetical protein
MQSDAGRNRLSPRPHHRWLWIASALLLGPGAAVAQDMPPGHGAAMSGPLFVQDLPVGSISVRLTRPSMTDPITDTAVVGTWKSPGGKPQTVAVKTGDDGRAMFTKVPVGATFSAMAEVDGETITTAEFEVPEQGGTRLLMIVGANAAAAMAEMTGQSPHGMGTPKALGVRSGKIEPRDGLPPGTVEVTVLAADGKPVPGVKVSLARSAGSLQVQQAETDAAGLARFKGLEAGGNGHWGAVVERDGMRVGTPPFALDEKRGSAGELRIPGRTTDLSALRVSNSTRMMVELREDSLAFLQNLVIENSSDKVFDPGPRGLFIPLPDGCTGTEKLAGGAEVEVKDGAGAFLHSLLPPTDSPAAAAQVRVGCVLTTHDTPEVEIVQPMPLGMQGGVAMVQATQDVGLSAPGIRARPAERDDNGNDLRMYELDSVPAGQPLRLVVFGLPAHEQTGKWIAGILAGLLVVAGAFAARRPHGAAPAENG